MEECLSWWISRFSPQWVKKSPCFNQSSRYFDFRVPEKVQRREYSTFGRKQRKRVKEGKLSRTIHIWLSNQVNKYLSIKKEIASKYETKNIAYSNNATTSSNSILHSQSNNRSAGVYSNISSRNFNNYSQNDSKSPFARLQDINTSPSISEHSYLKKSTKQSEGFSPLKRNWKSDFLKFEKARSQTKPISSLNTPKVNSTRDAVKEKADKVGHINKFTYKNNLIYSSQPLSMSVNIKIGSMNQAKHNSIERNKSIDRYSKQNLASLSVGHTGGYSNSYKNSIKSKENEGKQVSSKQVVERLFPRPKSANILKWEGCKDYHKISYYSKYFWLFLRCAHYFIHFF